MKNMLAALAAVWLVTPELWAADIDIENDTGQVICELRWTGPGGTGWLDNLLRGTCLNPGQTRRTSAETGGADLLAVFESGDYLVYYGLEPGPYRHPKLGAGEAEFFEWNPAADKP